MPEADDSSVPDDMKLAFALRKTKEYVDRDLEGMFARVLAENGGRVPALAAGVRERCYELERCRKVIEPGIIKPRP